jgi:hypothetical protein
MAVSQSVPAPCGANHNPLANWEDLASVLKAPTRYLHAAPDGLPFSEHLVPLMQHPEVIRRGDQVKFAILGQRLHSYNRFTSVLELCEVIPACADLALGNVPFSISGQAELGALKIAVDEADHARRAEQMTADLARLSGVQPAPYRKPKFLCTQKQGQQHPDRKWRSMSRLSFVCISETLITGILSKVPQDEAVIPEVRAIIADHARDEARHHNFFSDLMVEIWSQLPDDDRDVFGPMLVNSIITFLSPDHMAEADWLIASGFNQAEADRIVMDTQDSSDIADGLRKSSRPTLYQMKKSGILNHQPTLDALGAQGLI